MTEMMGVQFGLSQLNESIFDKDRNYALRKVTYGPLKELMQGILTCFHISIAQSAMGSSRVKFIYICTCNYLL